MRAAAAVLRCSTHACERLGQMQSLAGLAAVLAGCSVAPGPSTRRSPRVNPASDIVQSVRDECLQNATVRSTELPPACGVTVAAEL
ncbi:hypothetical protein RR48_01144 [Papilio machaon]|uniref:Uncharacterized protein n=1 Tax=Papilio machaon TaxID=76193 RepID=A0A0N1IBH4_PAPMA|nr:hypothetical protein RR48_01144 [Papilio machaon]